MCLYIFISFQLAFIDYNVSDTLINAGNVKINKFHQG